jgi:hypothetical protein
VPAVVSARERRFAADKDARILAAFASIAAQEAARDAVLRGPRVAKAQARVARGEARVAKVRAELLAKEQAQALRIANGGQRFRQVPVEDNSVMVTAKTKLVKAEQNLVTAQASGRRPALQIDPMGNLTDPDSRKMRRTGGGYMQAYNGQLAVTDDHLILVTRISQSPNDQSSGIPMINATVEAIEKLTATTGLARVTLGTLLLDAGYCSGDILTAPGPDRLISTGQSRELNNTADTPAPTRSPDQLSVIDKMTKRLAEPDNAALYKRRSATVEPVNGHIKDGRGLRQFSRRGLAAVESELSIAAWVTNLTRLYQHLHPAPAT